LHYQYPQSQGKLVYVLDGEIMDVAVDVRRDSPTFGRSISFCLSSENHRQLFLPEGFAHGFCVVSPSALVAYKCTAAYAPECERGIRWNDPALAITWPTAAPVLSAKDAALPPLAEIADDLLPIMPVRGDVRGPRNLVVVRPSIRRGRKSERGRRQRATPPAGDAGLAHLSY
jgi:dTDP-4-dehydrorhamnose 3,5-epimerase